MNSTKWSYLIVNKFVLLSLIKSVHYQTYVKYQIKSPSSHCYSAGFLCISLSCAYHCWCWLLHFWFGKISPQGQRIIYTPDRTKEIEAWGGYREKCDCVTVGGLQHGTLSQESRFCYIFVLFLLCLHLSLAGEFGDHGCVGVAAIQFVARY